MILNLTQHTATPEQVEAGVVDLPQGAREELKELLTFTSVPDADDLHRRAWKVAYLATCHGANPGDRVLIGGAPYFMAPLEKALKRRGITPLYAFSTRESVEEVAKDGTVRKTVVFRHIGFVGGF